MTNKEFIERAITKNHSGKMFGLQSLSVACTKCPLCIACHNTNDDLHICKHCYSFRQLARYKTLKEKLERNFDFFTTVKINSWDVPIINSSIFRFESFGDISNTLQFFNYVVIAMNNPQTTFALWSKRPHIIADSMKEFKIRKPENMIIIYSEPYIGKVWNEKEFQTLVKNYPVIDKVFTVHNTDKNVTINCGNKKCNECRVCYSHNNIHIINELLK